MMGILIANPHVLNGLSYNQRQQAFRTFGEWYRFTNEKSNLIAELQNTSNYRFYEYLNLVISQNTSQGQVALAYMNYLRIQHANVTNHLF